LQGFGKLKIHTFVTLNTVMVAKSSGNPNNHPKKLWIQPWSWGWELNPPRLRDCTRTTLFSLHIWQEPDKVGTQNH
jgi:hypothetical protein